MLQLKFDQRLVPAYNLIYRLDRQQLGIGRNWPNKSCREVSATKNCKDAQKKDCQAQNGKEKLS